MRFFKSRLERLGIREREARLELMCKFEPDPRWKPVETVSEVGGRLKPINVKAHKTLAQRNHPDRGGTSEAMAEINTARDRALAEVDE